MKYGVKNYLKIASLSFILLKGGSFQSKAEKSELKLAGIFIDNMVLQQNTNTPFWGWAGPGTNVILNASWGESASLTASQEGELDTENKNPGNRWKISIAYHFYCRCQHCTKQCFAC